jgi:hypothetical protein
LRAGERGKPPGQQGTTKQATCSERSSLSVAQIRGLQLARTGPGGRSGHLHTFRIGSKMEDAADGRAGEAMATRMERSCSRRGDLLSFCFRCVKACNVDERLSRSETGEGWLNRNPLSG